MPFQLPNLPALYPLDSLEPVPNPPGISQGNLSNHWDVIHRDFVMRANAAEIIYNDTSRPNHERAQALIELEETSAAHYMLTLFWDNLSPNASMSLPPPPSVREGGGNPSGILATMINQQWGSFSQFKADIRAQVVAHVGWGVAWVYYDRSGSDDIHIQIKNDYNLISSTIDAEVIMVIDFHDHAWLMDFASRGEYIDQIWQLINWNVVRTRLITGRSAAGFPP
eukprot:TRINITY_DN7626_c0_g1_i1.p1 TRINITY_DN7626_c0_g1~~TRINITY_DN7626_c0_g1_i1.p1  ORF type:complete len:224 (+),score=43.15 TRINITY_DN7626_c0_g1_i1:179-850(+)